jgi:hypothetical protein
MKKLQYVALLIVLLPTLSFAKETNMLYYQSKIPGMFGGNQISKDYYIKESLQRVESKNPNLLQVKIYSTVASPEGKTTYRYVEQINCIAREYTITQYWSSGFGNDDGTVVDGKWRSIDGYDGQPWDGGRS